MGIRRAQDERIEGTPDGLNAITEIMDVPDTPSIGTAVDNGSLGASVTFTAAVTGGTPASYTVTSTPGSITGTGSSSPITVSGLTAGTAYTFKVKAANAAGTFGPESSASNSVTPAFPVVGAYDSLASVTLSASTASVTFAGIPSGYKHLQIRCLVRSTDTSAYTVNYIQFNGDGYGNYTNHNLRGNGTSATATSATSQNSILATWPASTTAIANNFGAAVIDVLDYANVNKYKTIRSLNGFDNNGTAPNSIDYEKGMIVLTGGAWMNTAAINSFTLTPSTGTFAIYSSISLYGVK